MKIELTQKEIELVCVALGGMAEECGPYAAEVYKDVIALHNKFWHELEE